MISAWFNLDAGLNAICTDHPRPKVQISRSFLDDPVVWQTARQSDI